MKSKPEEQNKRATNHPTQHQWHEMNRKQRREITRQIQSEDLSLEVIHPDAGGIDIGNESHYVAVPPGRDNQSVRRFGCTTAPLKAMAARDRKSTRLNSSHGYIPYAALFLEKKKPVEPHLRYGPRERLEVHRFQDVAVVPEPVRRGDVVLFARRGEDYDRHGAAALVRLPSP